MRAILLPTGEMDSPRWQRLCNLLEVGTPGDRYRAYGHLNSWYQRWAGQQELDAGIWFRSSEIDVGSWACMEGGACKWGRSLIAAGYVGRIKDLYPEPLASLRKGYAALDQSGGVMLDEFFGVLRRRPNATTLVLYVMDRRARARWAHMLNVDVDALEGSGQIPMGWLDSAESGPGKAGESEQTPAQRVVETRQSHAEVVARVGVAAEDRRPVIGFGGTGGESKTAIVPPTSAMLQTVREYKYSDPLRALMALDGRDAAVWVWKRVIAKDPERVKQELGALVETESRWNQLRNPAGVITANFRRLGMLERG